MSMMASPRPEGNHAPRIHAEVVTLFKRLGIPSLPLVGSDPQQDNSARLGHLLRLTGRLQTTFHRWLALADSAVDADGAGDRANINRAVQLYRIADKVFAIALDLERRQEAEALRVAASLRLDRLGYSPGAAAPPVPSAVMSAEDVDLHRAAVARFNRIGVTGTGKGV